MAIISLSTRSHGRYIIMIICNEQIWDHISERSLYYKTTQGFTKTQISNKSNTGIVFKVEYIKYENMLGNVAKSIFFSGENSLTHFHPTRLYQFGLLTERKVERLPEFREEFLKEHIF